MLSPVLNRLWAPRAKMLLLGDNSFCRPCETTGRTGNMFRKILWSPISFNKSQ
ncbi:unnamed protein product [Mycena citricolor]|uniref:Uncharacterized protein n=1 Tax=Mycena citricolor TaxID=2018698 RepID=A0AAD2JUZ3_9AGAR|nr:unnamed protein product [Mycena citricolor]